MGAQSLVIGKMFGEGFQYGKRKISAMPNEEFNALTFKDMMSNARDEMKASIPTMQAALQDMQPMVETVVREFTNYLSLVIKEAPQASDQIVNDIAHQLFPHGETSDNSTEFQNFMDAIKNQFPSLPGAGAASAGPSLPIGPLKTSSGDFKLSTFSAPQTGPKIVIDPLNRPLKIPLTREQKIKEFNAIASKVTIPTSIHTIIPKPTILRKAGQTQRIARINLIQKIATDAQIIKGYQRARGPKLRAPFLPNAIARMLARQEQLKALLARYRW